MLKHFKAAHGGLGLLLYRDKSLECKSAPYKPLATLDIVCSEMHSVLLYLGSFTGDIHAIACMQKESRLRPECYLSVCFRTVLGHVRGYDNGSPANK